MSATLWSAAAPSRAATGDGVVAEPQAVKSGWGRSNVADWTGSVPLEVFDFQLLGVV
jgi:hypothetical protein